MKHSPDKTCKSLKTDDGGDDDGDDDNDDV